MSAAGLYPSLVSLVENYGLEDVSKALDVVRASVSQGRTERKSEQYASPYEGWIVASTDKAVKWWIPSQGNPAAERGLSQWVPRVLIVRYVVPDGDPNNPMGELTTVRPIEWRPARRVGNDVQFTDRRSA